MDFQLFCRFSQLLAPLIHADINGKPKTLFMTSTEQMREATKPHLRMTLQGKTTLYLRLKKKRFILLFFRTRIDEWHRNVSRRSCSSVSHARDLIINQFYGNFDDEIAVKTN